MFTLRLIFYGLIAFVPGQNNDGMMAVAVDTHALDSMTPHIAVVLRVRECGWHGSCLELLDIPHGARVDLEPTFVSPWHSVVGMRTLEGAQQKVLPSSDWEAQDLTWLPQMEWITPEAGQVRPECLIYPEYCPILATFRLWHGSVRSCHLTHLLENHGRQEFYPLTYRFKGASASSGDLVQAVADAVLVEIPIPYWHARLIKSSFGSDYWEKVADLQPEENGSITLIFANLATSVDRPEPPAAGTRLSISDLDRWPHLHHFQSFYRLALPLSFPLQEKIPYLSLEHQEHPVPMLCEPEILLLEALIKAYNNNRYEAAEADRPAVPAGGPEVRALAALLAKLRDDPGFLVYPHSLEVCGGTGFTPMQLQPFANLGVAGLDGRQLYRHQFVKEPAAQP